MKTGFKGLMNFALLGVVGLVAVTAHAAATPTAYFEISEIEVGAAPEDGIIVLPVSGTSIPNPFSCTQPTYVYANPSRTAAEKTEMSKLITAAFLSGKKIKLFVNTGRCSGTGSTGAPVYDYVSLNKDQ
jgi:hypothetical protein